MIVFIVKCCEYVYLFFINDGFCIDDYLSDIDIMDLIRNGL